MQNDESRAYIHQLESTLESGREVHNALLSELQRAREAVAAAGIQGDTRRDGEIMAARMGRELPQDVAACHKLIRDMQQQQQQGMVELRLRFKESLDKQVTGTIV